MRKIKINILLRLPAENTILNISKQNGDEKSNYKKCQIATIIPARIKLKSVILSQASPLGIRR